MEAPFGSSHQTAVALSAAGAGQPPATAEMDCSLCLLDHTQKFGTGAFEDAEREA